ncbi:MAG: VgrG-related protein [Actinobacteria bacterium]|nr:VgrG-related protein [Actinomycetota bacterium]
MAAERRLDAVALTVDGSELPAPLYDRLAMVRVEESVHLPDQFTIRFDDPHFELFDEARFTVGTRIDIAFRAEDSLVTVTSGEVTALSVEQGAGGRHELALTGLDVAHRLARAPRSRSYLNMTDADIAAQIADEHGLDTDISATGEVHEYVLQVSESDYAFLSRRAQRIGFDLWVSGTTLHLRPTPTTDAAAPTLTWGGNLHAFRVRFSSSERCDQVTVRGHDAVGKRTIVGRASDGDPGTDAPAVSELADDARAAFGTIERSAGQFPMTTQREADALATALLSTASGAEVIARGEAQGDPLIAAGADVTIDRVGTRLAGTWRVTSVQHIYGTGSPYVTRFVCGGKQPTGLVDLVGSTGGREQRRTWGGLVVGIVTNCDDPLQLGRAKVKYPTLTDDDESAWARVVTVGAGPDRGVQCIPEVGDEVVVGFESNDPDRPLIIGGVWNREDRPPDPDAVAGGQVARRVWRSRTGHHVELADDDPASVTVATGEADCRLVLNGDDSALHAEGALEVSGREVTVRADQKLTLQATSIEIAASADVTVAGTPIKLN